MPDEPRDRVHGGAGDRYQDDGLVGHQQLGWDGLRTELAADVRRVSDRLRSMSAARLAGQLAPPDQGRPGYRSRAQAARAVATALADTAAALEAAAGCGAPAGLGLRDTHSLPELGDLAAADQLQVTGNDLLAAMDLVGPERLVPAAPDAMQPARDGVTHAASLLADLRRRL